MKARSKQIWQGMTAEQRRKALVYYCNLSDQVHHNCEHGGKDFAEPHIKDTEAAEFVAQENQCCEFHATCGHVGMSCGGDNGTAYAARENAAREFVAQENQEPSRDDRFEATPDVHFDASLLTGMNPVK